MNDLLRHYNREIESVFGSCSPNYPPRQQRLADLYFGIIDGESRDAFVLALIGRLAVHEARARN